MEFSINDPFVFCRIVLSAKKLVDNIPMPGGLPLVTELDSNHEGARMLYKLNELIPKLADDWYVVNSLKINEAPGTFYLLAKSKPLYSYFLVDTQSFSVSLIFSSADLKAYIRSITLNRYLFYRLPEIVNRPVFINTKVLCSRWHELKGDTFKAFNVLESHLFKDPSIRSF